MTAATTASADLPPIRIARCNPVRREPGLMLFNVRGESRAGDKQSYSGWVLGIGQSGDRVIS